ncbi:MAG: T9SS type A sorting domain-containing protein [Bacteroidia bacterium]|nr:T9SS type A sorting domain-containing protein [Bacteroidia bacterium]
MNAPLLHVDENKHITSLSLYPNPNSGSFILDFILPHAQDFRVNIYDLPGRAVWTEELKQQVTGERKIDFHPAAPGVYIVQALSAGIVFTEKISVVW